MEYRGDGKTIRGSSGLLRRLTSPGPRPVLPVISSRRMTQKSAESRRCGSRFPSSQRRRSSQNSFRSPKLNKTLRILYENRQRLTQCTRKGGRDEDKGSEEKAGDCGKDYTTLSTAAKRRERGAEVEFLLKESAKLEKKQANLLSALVRKFSPRATPLRHVLVPQSIDSLASTLLPSRLPSAATLSPKSNSVIPRKLLTQPTSIHVKLPQLTEESPCVNLTGHGN